MTPGQWLQIAVALSRIVSWIMDKKAFAKGVEAERSKNDEAGRAAALEVRKALAAIDARLSSPDGVREPDAHKRS